MLHAKFNFKRIWVLILINDGLWIINKGKVVKSAWSLFYKSNLKLTSFFKISGLILEATSVIMFSKVRLNELVLNNFELSF